MNQICIPSGKRNKYKSLARELFYQDNEKNLYIRFNNKWILLCGNGKQDKIEAGTNLEIIKNKLRLKDDIDIDSMTLGKFSNTIRWKGMVCLGEVKNSTIFPLIKYIENSNEIIGGKFLLKIYRDNEVEYGIYHASAAASGKGSIFGSDDQNIKCTLDLVTYDNGIRLIGFKTFSSLRTTHETTTITTDSEGLSSTVNFILNSKSSIQITSSQGRANFTLLDWEDTGNVNTTGNHWYEISMVDFRLITGIPLNTGSDLDLFDNNSYMYWDIYTTDTQFSIDRVFITKQKSHNEDEAVSEGRVFCHNPSWLVPNDKHTVDVSDGFTFMDNIFTSTSENNDYTAGVPIKIMDVYMVIPGTTKEVTITKTTYLPPDKIEVWFNGFDNRIEKPIIGNNISNDIVISRE